MDLLVGWEVGMGDRKGKGIFFLRGGGMEEEEWGWKRERGGGD